MLPKAVHVFMLVCMSGCLASPVPDSLDYLPTLAYLRAVLRFSTNSLSELKVDSTLPLEFDISRALSNVRQLLANTQKAAEQIVNLLQAKDTFSNMQLLNETLHQMHQSLWNPDFHFPEYFRKEYASLELELLNRTMNEHLARVDFNKETLEFNDLREINSFLTGATSQAMSATVAVLLISTVEKLQYYLKVLLLPNSMEAMELQNLQDINQLVRSYHQLYGAALNVASNRYLREVAEGAQQLQSMIHSLEYPQDDLKKAATQFSDQVDIFFQTALSDLQTMEQNADVRFAEVLQNIFYTSYGLVSSGMGMLRPYVRHIRCVRELVPRAQTVAGAYNETLDIIDANTDVVKSFVVDIEPYRLQLFGCLTSRYEIEMAKVLDMAYNFDKCVKITK
uniref:Uncharacterized protein n=1 Tax=Anopheles maculatus TaxID=74869 RepID=A0A182S7X7_9DIPT